MRRLAIGIAAVVAAATSSCVPLPRYPSVVPRSDPVPSERLSKRLDPWLLAEGLADKVVVEVDWVEGCEPAPLTLDGLKRILEKYGPPGRPVEIRRSDRIPRSEWDALPKGDRDDPVEALVSAHADPTEEPGVEHRYVIFAPRAGRSGLFGYSRTWWVERDGATREVSGVAIFRDTHARYDILWVSLDEIERMSLIHEFGHQLGLVADPRHERSHPSHRIHCTRLDCVMAHPTRRLWFRNLWRGVFDVWLRDYCPECQAEIRTAQAEWRRERAADPKWEETRVSERGEAARQARDWKEVDEALRGKSREAQIEECERHLAEHPDSRVFAERRIYALLALERLDEALAALEAYPAKDEVDWARVARNPAASLVGAGRHEEALALLRRALDARGHGLGLEDYTFEQSSHLLGTALEGLGRYREAAEVALRLAEKGRGFSYSRDGMTATAGDLFRRAGDLDRAASLIESVYRSKRTRRVAIDAMYRLRIAQGRHEEARKVLERALASKIEDSISDDPDVNAGRAYPVFARALRLALLGRRAEVEAALARGVELAERSRAPEYYRFTRASVLVALGDHGTAAELLRKRSKREREIDDLCGADWAEPLRADPRSADLFEACPARASRETELGSPTRRVPSR